jgi:hypothetical protein
MDKLTMIEKVMATMDAKETRTLIMLCNDRLAALGEPVHVGVPAPTPSHKTKSKGGFRRRPYHLKELPDNNLVGLKTFKDLDTDWVNDLQAYGSPVVCAVRGCLYHVIQYKKGANLMIGTVSIADAEQLSSGATVHQALSSI